MNRHPKKQTEIFSEGIHLSLGLEGFPAISKEDEKLTAKNHHKYKETRHQEQEPAERTEQSTNGRGSFEYE